MLDRELIDKIRRFKEEHRYTLHDLSTRLDVQVATIERWLKTGRINKVYAQIAKERLGIE